MSKNTENKSAPENEAAKDQLDPRLRMRFGAMEQEIRRLQARSRFLGTGMAMAIMVAAASWLVKPLFGNTSPENTILEARGVVLVGPDGTPRGEWTVDDAGNASFGMFDRQERERLSISVRSEGYPGLSLSNEAGERRVALGLLPDETTTLVFADGQGVPRAVLGLVRGDAANLLLADSEGVSRIGFGLDSGGVGSVILPNESANMPTGDRE